ncbi:COX aromatic rich motif-containing protein, partial [Francisella tularensis]|uniref:COX aromatic rich motif-containing protein n=1 Tax=Francisella tularensis TaxID=263 RepID=UPI001F2B4AFB
FIGIVVAGVALLGGITYFRKWGYLWSDLFKDSIDNPVAYYSHVDKNLFNDIVMSYMMPNYKPGDMASNMSGMHMHHDM